MTGHNDSVATRWLEEAPQATAVHAVAHRLKSAFSDAFESVPYLGVVGESLRGLCSFTSDSWSDRHVGCPWRTSYEAAEDELYSLARKSG